MFKPQTDGDLVAVILAESFDLLGRIVGPYMYTVAPDRDGDVASFQTAEMHALFCIRVHEFLADATRVSPGTQLPQSLSLLNGGAWIADHDADRADRTELRAAYGRAISWFAREQRIVFWSGSLQRHLRLTLPMSGLLSMRANMEKHQLLRLAKEIERLHGRCTAAGCDLTMAQSVAARPEFEAHVKGMLEYHSTEIAEHVGGCLRALHAYASDIYRANPTNNLDLATAPSDLSDDVFRYMYTSTVFQLSQWTEHRIVSATPRTPASLKKPYRQHNEWSIVERERDT